MSCKLVIVCLGFCRSIHLFEFRIDDETVSMNPNMFAAGQMEKLEVVGKGGLSSQCGLFGNYDLDWFWGRQSWVTFTHDQLN